MFDHSVKKFFQISNVNLLWGNLRLFNHVLLIVTWETVLGLASVDSTDIEGLLLGDLELSDLALHV